MSDLSDTPHVPEQDWCPGCPPEWCPDGPPPHLHYCPDHMPAMEGTVDRLLDPPGPIPLLGEAGGEDNQRMCGILHRSQ